MLKRRDEKEGRRSGFQQQCLSLSFSQQIQSDPGTQLGIKFEQHTRRGRESRMRRKGWRERNAERIDMPFASRSLSLPTRSPACASASKVQMQNGCRRQVEGSSSLDSGIPFHPFRPPSSLLASGSSRRSSLSSCSRESKGRMGCQIESSNSCCLHAFPPLKCD